MTSIPIREVIEGQRVSRVQIYVAIACAAILFCDAFSLQAVAVAGPAIRSDLEIEPKMMGIVFSLGLVGMMLGAILVGPLTERFGHKWPLVFLALWFSFCTILTVLADSAWSLAGLRFLDGLGLGAAIPKALALTSEYSATRVRRLTVSLTMVGYAAGGVAAGFIGAKLVPQGGWHMVFIVSGMLGIGASALVAIVVPESLNHLVKKPDRIRELQQIVSVVAPQYADASSFQATPSSRRSSIFRLFSPELLFLTLGLWAVAFLAQMDMFLYINWTPIFAEAAGIPLDQSIMINLYYNAGAMAGIVLVGWAMDRANPAFIIAAALTVACLSLGAMAIAGLQANLLMASSAGVGFGLGGGATGISLLAATLYDGDVKVTGIGWALGVGRIGSAVGPLIGGGSMGSGLSVLFVMAAVPALMAAIFATMLGYHLRQSPRP